MLRVGIGEYDTGWHDPARSLDRAERVVAAAAREGARLVALPEMCTTGFTMDASQAQSPDGTSVRTLGDMARRAGTHVLAGTPLLERVGDGERVVNAALLIDPCGTVVTCYRKQRLFAYAGEHAVYAPGTAPVTAVIDGVRVAPFVCYDLRFPELFRRVARDVDAVVLIANWPAARRAHWDVLVRARAIENQCYVVAVNRTGEGGGITYDGGSVAYDPWGEPVPSRGGEVPCVDIDPDRVRDIRGRYPFLADYAG